MVRAVALAAAAVVSLSALSSAAVTATVSGASNVKPISPLIYGSNQNSIPSTNDRLGGNRWTAYNWENNASNAGSDYRYQSDGFLSQSNAPAQAVLPTLTAAAAAGRAVTLTVPIVGYVSADKNGPTSNTGSDRFTGRFFTSQASTPGGVPPAAPVTTDNVVYQDQFVNYVNARRTNNQQVLYNLDNEPDLWSSTHPEVHPAAVTYSELIQRNIDYATAIKRVVPGAKVLGSVNYGWNGYRTLQNAPDANGRDWHAAYLAAMKAAGDAAGKRLIDSLDFHYYSEASSGTTASGTRVTFGDPPNAGVAISPAVVAARLQSPRSLWDPTYIENSWITRDNLPAGGKAIRLLPRTQAIIDQNYPGTLMSIGEYNFGASNHISGGIAQADALGIFAEQGVYSANWWDLTGEVDAFVAAAQRIYLNYDGAGGKFGDTSLGSSVSDNGLASVHASRDSATGRLVLVVINKSDAAQSLDVSLANLAQYAGAKAYGFNGATAVDNGNVPIAATAGVTVKAGGLSYTMSPLSVTAISLRPALPGDADLDGGVSIDDFNIVSQNFGKTGKLWTDGDFDYDGGVSINDFNLLASHFGERMAAGGTGWADLLAFAAAHDDLDAFAAATGVPDPAGLGGVTLVAALLGRRRF